MRFSAIMVFFERGFLQRNIFIYFFCVRIDYLFFNKLFYRKINYFRKNNYLDFLDNKWKNTDAFPNIWIGRIVATTDFPIEYWLIYRNKNQPIQYLCLIFSFFLDGIRIFLWYWYLNKVNFRSKFYSFCKLFQMMKIDVYILAVQISFSRIYAVFRMSA